MKRTYRDYMGVGEKKSITNSKKVVKSGLIDEDNSDKFEEFAGDLLMSIINLVKEKMNQYGATKEDAVLALNRLEPEDPKGYMSYIESSKKAVKSAFWDDNYDDGYTSWDVIHDGEHDCLYTELFYMACEELNVCSVPDPDVGYDGFVDVESDELVGKVKWSRECHFMDDLIMKHSKGKMSDEDFVAAVENFVKQHLSKEGVKSSKKVGKPSKKVVKSSF